MDVNQVRFGNYSIGSKGAGAKRSEVKGEKASSDVKNENISQKNPDEVINAMNLAGLQNKAQISMISHKEVNPAEFLSDDRISDIEAMMERFEAGVNKVADVIEAEFPAMFSTEQKNALAASIFAKEQ